MSKSGNILSPWKYLLLKKKKEEIEPMTYDLAPLETHAPVLKTNKHGSYNTEYIAFHLNIQDPDKNLKKPLV